MKSDTMNGQVARPVDADTLRRMDSNLRDFLEHSLSSESFWETWTALSFPVEKIRFREIKNCSRTAWPSFHAEDFRSALPPVSSP